jgi:hypothetical protein
VGDEFMCHFVCSEIQGRNIAAAATLILSFRGHIIPETT